MTRQGVEICRRAAAVLYLGVSREVPPAEGPEVGPRLGPLRERRPGLLPAPSSLAPEVKITFPSFLYSWVLKEEPSNEEVHPSLPTSLLLLAGMQVR